MRGKDKGNNEGRKTKTKRERGLPVSHVRSLLQLVQDQGLYHMSGTEWPTVQPKCHFTAIAVDIHAQN